MTEQLLQFIWQFRHFNATELTTTAGEALEIIHPGIHNRNQGPDFLNAKIKCGGTILAGSIEIHTRSSEWVAHGHSSDRNYDNVILHVVLQEDRQLELSFPSLELAGRISKIMLVKYEQLMLNRSFISCGEHLPNTDPITVSAWKQRLFIERLQEKSAYIRGLLEAQGFHWENVFWQMLAKHFGTGVNNDAFERMAASLPVSILAKHKSQPLQLEAMLMGRAGMLEGDFNESYPQMLQKEFRFLKRKYALADSHIAVHSLRMRPAGFPGVRLSQLAMLVQRSNHLFSKVKDAGSIKELRGMFAATANDYWHYHYSFGEISAFKKKAIGAQMIENIILNTVLPMLFTYGSYNKLERYIALAVSRGEEIKPEKNHITAGFERLGVENISAADSQALIQLKHRYCDLKRCLDCAIGNRILKADGNGA